MFEQDITVVISTSPLHCNPSTEVIDESYAQIRKQLPDVPVILLMDGVHPEQPFLTDRYNEFKAAIRQKTWTNFTAIEFPDWQHRTGTLQKLFLDSNHIKTPLALVVEHDKAFCSRKIDWAGLESVLLSGEFANIRFELDPETELEKVNGGKMVQGRVQSPPLLRTQFYEGDAPQLVRVDYFTQYIAAFGKSKCYLETGIGVGEWVKKRTSFACAVYAPETTVTTYNLFGHDRGQKEGWRDWGRPYVITELKGLHYVHKLPYRPPQ